LADGLFILAGAIFIGALVWLFWVYINKPFLFIWNKLKLIPRLRLTIAPREAQLSTSVGLKPVVTYNLQKAIPQDNVIEFYHTRDEMIAKRGTLPTELQDMKKVWASWWTAISPTSMRIFDPNTVKRQPSVNRMILFHPCGKYIKAHTAIDARDETVLTNQIEASRIEAQSVGVEVRFFDGFIEGMIIADPISADEDQFSDESWIRVETAVPYRNNKDCCNFVIYKKQDHDLFDALLEHYKLLWGKSVSNPNNIGGLDEESS